MYLMSVYEETLELRRNTIYQYAQYIQFISPTDVTLEHVTYMYLYVTFLSIDTILHHLWSGSWISGCS